MTRRGDSARRGGVRAASTARTLGRERVGRRCGRTARATARPMPARQERDAPVPGSRLAAPQRASHRLDRALVTELPPGALQPAPRGVCGRHAPRLQVALDEGGVVSFPAGAHGGLRCDDDHGAESAASALTERAGPACLSGRFEPASPSQSPDWHVPRGVRTNARASAGARQGLLAEPWPLAGFSTATSSNACAPPERLRGRSGRARRRGRCRRGAAPASRQRRREPGIRS